jgi:hypothetical protein
MTCCWLMQAYSCLGWLHGVCEASWGGWVQGMGPGLFATWTVFACAGMLISMAWHDGRRVL